MRVTGWGGGLFSRGGVEDTRLEAKAKDTKKSEAKAKDSLSEDRHSRGQGQECSRPRPRIKEVLSKKKKEGLLSGDFQKKKKRSSQKFFRRFPQKNVFQKIFQALHKLLTIQKIVLSSSRGQVNFRGLEASKGLDLRGQGLQNVSSRTSSRPRTSSRTPPLLFRTQNFSTVVLRFKISSHCGVYRQIIADLYHNFVLFCNSAWLNINKTD